MGKSDLNIIENKLLELGEISASLEPGPDDRADYMNSLKKYTEDFYLNSFDEPTYNPDFSSVAKLEEYPLQENPRPLNVLLEVVKDSVDRTGLNPASPGHLGYIPGGGLFPSALGDFMADITNRYAGVYFANPGAVKMENILIRWMAGLFGYPETSAGNLASGGSIANLTAIVTARDYHNVNSKNLTDQVIYMTDHVHHCIDKAIRIAGLAECITRFISRDDHYRMNADHLAECIIKDKEDGLQPFMVIASAGTTDTGAMDPLEEIGYITKAQGVWYHIDAAYGGFFILTEEGREILKGSSMSDSLVVDPHKGLFLPYGTGAVIIKNGRALINSHYYQANYMQDTEGSDEELSPASLSPELTKHFRGLRMWLPLQLSGLQPFRAALEEKLLLARYFFLKLKESNLFETGPYPDLSVVIYRMKSHHDQINENNLKLVKAVQSDGRVFISSTKIDGEVWLRLAVMVFRTKKDTIDILLEILLDRAMTISDQSS